MESGIFQHESTSSHKPNFFRKYLIFSSRISEFKSHSFTLACAYVILMYSLWWMELLDLLHTVPLIKNSLTIFDNYIVWIVTEYFTVVGLSTKLTFQSETRFIYVIVSVLMAFNIIYLACFAYCWCSDLTRKSFRYETPWKVLNMLHSCFFWVLLLPIFHVSFRAMYLFINTQITQGTATTITHIMLVFTLLNILTALFIFFNSAYFYNEIRVDERDALAGANDDFKKICGVIKIVTLVLRHFLADRDLFGVILALEALNHLTMIILVYFTRVLYNDTLNKLLAIMASLTFVLTLSSAIIQISDLTLHYDPLLITIMAAPIIAKALIVLISRKDAVPVKYYGKDIKTAREAYYYVSFLLHKVVNKTVSRSEYDIILLSVYIHHEMNCERPDCFCSQAPRLNKDRYDNGSTMINSWNCDVFESKMVLYVEHLFHHFLKKYPNSPHLNLAFSNFLIRYLGNIPKSIYYLSCARNHSTGVKFQYYIFKTMNEIQNYMWLFNNDSNDATNNLELVKALQISQKYEQLLTHFENALKRNIEFFEVLCEDKANKEGVLTKIVKSHEANRYLERHFRELHAACSKQMGSLFVFGLYNLVILNKMDAYEYLKVAERIKCSMIRFEASNKMFRKLEQVVSSDPGLIMISGEREKLGVIQYVSQSLVTMLGYVQSELLTQKIDKIIPTTIAQHHNRYMRRFESHGNPTLFRTMRKMFARHTLGHMIPVHVLVKPVFTIEKGMQYLGMLKESKETIQYILTDRLGFIDSMTLDLIQKLKIDSILFNSNLFKVDHFIKGIRHYYDKLNEKINEMSPHQLIKEQGSLMHVFDTSVIFNEKTIRKLVEKKKRSPLNKQITTKPRKSSYHLFEKNSSHKDSSKESDSSTITNVQALFSASPERSQKKKSIHSPERELLFSSPVQRIPTFSTHNHGSSTALGSRFSFGPSLIQTKEFQGLGHQTVVLGRSNTQITSAPSHNNTMTTQITTNRMQPSMFSSPNDIQLHAHPRTLSLETQEFSCKCKIQKLPLFQNPEVFIVVELSDLYIDKKRESILQRTFDASPLNVTTAIRNYSSSDRSERILSSTVNFEHNKVKGSKGGRIQPLQPSTISSSNEAAARHMNLNRCLEEFKSSRLDRFAHYLAALLALLSVVMQILSIVSVYDFNDEINQKSLYVNLYYPSQTFSFEMAASSYLLEFINATTTEQELATVPAFSSEVYTNFYQNVASFMMIVVNETQSFLNNLILQPDVYDSHSFLNVYAQEISISLNDQPTTLQFLTYFSLLIGSSLRVAHLSNGNDFHSSIAVLQSVTNNLVTNQTSLSVLQKNSDQLAQILDLSTNEAYFIVNIVVTSLFAILVFFLIQRSVKMVNLTYNSIYWLRNFNHLFYESHRRILTNFQLLKSEINQIHSSFEPHILASAKHTEDLIEQKMRLGSTVGYTHRARAQEASTNFLQKEKSKASFWIFLYLAANIALIVFLRMDLNSFSSKISLHLSLENDFSEERFYGTELLARQLYIVEQWQLHGQAWNGTAAALSRMQTSFDSFMRKSSNNDMLTAKILSESQWYSELYQGDFCKLFFNAGTVLIDYCQKIFEGAASRGYPAFKSKLKDRIVMQQNEILAGTLEYNLNSERIEIIDIFATYFYIDKNLQTFLTEQLTSQSDDAQKNNKILNLVLVIAMNVSTIVYWVAYYRISNKIIKKATLIKRALRFFSDEAILSNKRVVVQICKTSSLSSKHVLGNSL